VANWALEELGVFRLELGHRVNNPASGAIAVAAGFLPEGRDRQKLRYGDERFDTLSYSRLATDPFPRTPSVTFELPSLPLPPDRHGA
jgi:RimJ/RimL family protein N-acetyltransferase